MAKTLNMSRPYTLLRQALPASSLLQPSKPNFVSQSAVFSNKAQTSVWWSCTNNNNQSKLQIDSHGYKLSKFESELVGSRRFTTRATHVNDPGSIDSPLMQSMEEKVQIFKTVVIVEFH